MDVTQIKREDVKLAWQEACAHWLRMSLNGRLDGKDEPSMDECALCKLFGAGYEIERSRTIPPTCEVGCPVFLETGSRMCRDTPYFRASDLWYDESSSEDKVKDACEDEYKFLLCLEPIVKIWEPNMTLDRVMEITGGQSLSNATTDA